MFYIFLWAQSNTDIEKIQICFTVHNLIIDMHVRRIGLYVNM